jgi:glycine/D-amino acid oxidase-like deaminating enzyme
VVVIGGGIFGATCAAELGEFCDDTLLERHPDLLAEASNLNQWRYHHGFHYPRSVEMINEIKECRHAFEEVYGEAVIGGISSYYATAKAAKIITGERYLHTCTAMGLAFEIAPPPKDVLDLTQVSLCLRTGEGVFDANIMRAIMRRRLGERAGITLALGHDVVDGALLGDGRKRLVLKNGDSTREASFDYVVNATYANRNLLTRLFGFPMDPLRFDLLELLLLEVSLPRMSVTILDGPFTSLVSMGVDNQFTLSHIQHSLLASETPADGFPPVWTERPSNRENLLREATRYLPILHNARYLGSRYGTRAVNARPQDVDGRPTVVVDHGFGCWSILGGKVNTSVSNARQIANQIASQQRIDRPDKGAIERRVVDEGQLWRDRSPVGARRS